MPMELYDVIFIRQSIRKFKRESLSSGQEAMILDFASKARPLYPHIKTKMVIVPPSEIKGMMAIKSPHYLLLYSEKKDGDFLNAGFLLQQVDLFLSTQGIGSCWLGMIKPKAPSLDGLDFVVMLAIGAPQEPLHRTDPSEFVRKPLQEIAQGRDPRLEAARLAPSASNRQPWYFVCGEGDIRVYRNKPAGLMGPIYDRLTQFDLGIALCHLMLAGEKQGVRFAFDDSAALPALENLLPVGVVRG